MKDAVSVSYRQADKHTNILSPLKKEIEMKHNDFVFVFFFLL